MLLGQHKGFVLTPTKMVILPVLQYVKDILEYSKRSQLNAGKYEYYSVINSFNLIQLNLSLEDIHYFRCPQWEDLNVTKTMKFIP